MIRNTSKYQYKQLETYKELLELKHMKIKSYIVNAMIFIMGIVVTLVLFRLDYDLTKTYIVMFMFVLLLGLNIALFSYNNDLYNNVKLSMYANVLGMYAISATLILQFRTPSIFTSLFLVYAITAVYQDYKVMILSNTSLFIFGGLIAMLYPGVFSIPGINEMHTAYIVIYLVLFVMLLTLSSYILIKRKTFFYSQLAKIKESEIRSLRLLEEVEYHKTKVDFDENEYYDSLDQFSKALSEKLGIENTFERKIEMLKELKHKSIADIMSAFPEFSETQINKVSLMELKVNRKMKDIAIKGSLSENIEVEKKEIFSEQLFKSFKHSSDDLYTKIISFTVFYCLLKVDKVFLEQFSEEKLKDVLTNSEYFYKIDRRVFDVYYNNSEVFDTIVSDILKGEYYND